MIKIIGIGRVAVLCLLLAINGAAFYFLHSVLSVEKQKTEMALQTLKGESDALRAEISRLREEFDLLKEELKTFRLLEARKFFNDQSRTLARDYLDYLARRNELTKMRYDIKPANIISTAETIASGYTIVRSPISIDIESYQDLDVFAFMKMIAETFPGIVMVNALSLERSGEIDTNTLQQMQQGQSRTFVRGKVDLGWFSMISQDDVRRVEEIKAGTQP